MKKGGEGVSITAGFLYLEFDQVIGLGLDEEQSWRQGDTKQSTSREAETYGGMFLLVI